MASTVRGKAKVQRPPRQRVIFPASLPPLPLHPEHWPAVFHRLELSPQEAMVVELILRDQSLKQMAQIMGLAEPTIRTYLVRVRSKTGTCSRMQLAMRVLAVSHEVMDRNPRQSKR